MCDVISRELMVFKNYYLIGTISHLHNMVLMYTLIYNRCSYSYPIRMDAYFVCDFSIILRGTESTKGCIPPPHTKFNDCIYKCLVNGNQLLGDAVLVILLLIPRY